MIFADKIIKLRKRMGLSQEELADKMDTSRQAVSKWEGAQSIPDINKIVQLANLFGVTIDYLLKDDMEDEEYS
ncbi:MAG: helix-turn-helix transcriptional regulator, partial [Erysipelotrichaceae bacterium]